MQLFISNLDPSLKKDELLIFLELVGKVKNLNLVMDPFKDENKGFATVEYENEEDAEKALKELNLRNLKNKLIKISKIDFVEEQRPEDAIYH